MEADIKCRNCGNSKFELHFSGMDKSNKCKRSIIAVCRCGRRVENRGIDEVIELPSWGKQEAAK